MAEEYKRTDKSDLSGMTKEAALSHLKPYYKTDEDLSVDNLKMAFGPWVLAIVLIGCAVGLVWSLAVLF